MCIYAYIQGMMHKVPAMKTLLFATGVAALAVATPSAAQSAGKDGKTPSGWSYEIKNGQRVPKANRVVHADGSWTEEIKQGNCTVTRTGRSGEVRETRQCN